MRYFVGIDGGGTRTTLGIADETGRELLRRVGPAGLVDPLRPAETAQLLVELVREAAASASMDGPAAALCAGLAGVGNPADRALVEATFVGSGVADRVAIITDGEAALLGALGDAPGILVIAGTGSVAYGRGEDGRTARCGGWGMILGDEGSGYEVGCAGLRAALMAADGRGPRTQLLNVLPDVLGVGSVEELPSWVARAEKAEVARIAPHVLRLADGGDAAAREIIVAAALDLALHVDALMDRLGPWSQPPAVVLHGGFARDPLFSSHLAGVLRGRPRSVRLTEPAADPVTGTLAYARRLGSDSAT